MTRRAVAFAVAIALHAGFAWVLFAPKPASEASRQTASRAQVDALASSGDADSLSAPHSRRPQRSSAARPARRYEPGEAAARFATAAERQAYARGVEYELSRRDASQRYYARILGDEIAGLMQLPLDEAWTALEQRALAGDARAAEALNALSGNCSFDPFDPGRRGEKYRFMRDRASAGLAAPDRAFVHGALDTELLAIESDEQACRAAGLGRDRLVRLAERRLETLGRPEAPPSGDDSHAWLEYYARAFPPIEQSPFPTEPSPQARRWLERIDDALDPAAWRELSREAPDDPALVARIAYCALAKCGDLPPEAWDEATHYVERAAQNGLPQAIQSVIAREVEASALAQAHAWAEFGMWIIESGCFAVPQALEYADLARERAAIATRLTAVQFADARRRFAVLIQAHGNAALVAHGCRP